MSDSARAVVQCACERAVRWHGREHAIACGWRCVGGCWRCPEHVPAAPAVTEADLDGPRAFRAVESVYEVDPGRGAILARALWSRSSARGRRYVEAWAGRALGVTVTVDCDGLA